MCALDLCGSSYREMGFAEMVKKLHLPQLGDKTFRYFKMTQIDQDISHK
jgi:hypothetical protein